MVRCEFCSCDCPLKSIGWVYHAIRQCDQTRQGDPHLRPLHCQAGSAAAGEDNIQISAGGWYIPIIEFQKSGAGDGLTVDLKGQSVRTRKKSIGRSIRTQQVPFVNGDRLSATQFDLLGFEDFGRKTAIGFDEINDIVNDQRLVAIRGDRDAKLQRVPWDNHRLDDFELADRYEDRCEIPETSSFQHGLV